MKKTMLVLAITLGLCANAYSQYFVSVDKHNNRGLFCRGIVGDELYYGAGLDRYFNNNDLPLLPFHDLEDDQSATPIGSGALLLLAFGATYAVAKKRRDK